MEKSNKKSSLEMTAASIAIRDIQEDRRKEGKRNCTFYQSETGEKYAEIWDVSEQHLYSKEQRKLNRQLGISYINNDFKHLKK